MDKIFFRSEYDYGIIAEKVGGAMTSLLDLSKILKQQRIGIPLTLRELSAMSGVTSSHLGRIERDERFPSAPVLHRIAKPLGFEEDEIFSLAGYLSPQPLTAAEKVTEGDGNMLT